MRTYEYCIEGLNLKIEIEQNEDLSKRLTAYYILAIREETGMSRLQSLANGLGCRLECFKHGNRDKGNV